MTVRLRQTVKDKMIEALAIYVGNVRDGRDAMASDEDIAEKAYSIMAQTADELLEGGDYGVLADLLLTPVPEYVEDTWNSEPEPTSSDVADALRALVKALGVTL